MCGIVCEYHPGGRVDPAALGEALVALRPRGPDGEGIWISANGDVGLGHVRLAILDIEGSSQPIASEDGQIILTVNGEFYDHEALRRALERALLLYSSVQPRNKDLRRFADHQIRTYGDRRE